MSRLTCRRGVNESRPFGYSQTHTLIVKHGPKPRPRSSGYKTYGPRPDPLVPRQSEVIKKTDDQQRGIEHRNRERKAAAESKNQEENQESRRLQKTESGETVQRRTKRDCTGIEATTAIKREGGRFIRRSPTDGPGGEPEPLRHPFDPVKETKEKPIPNGVEAQCIMGCKGRRNWVEKWIKYWEKMGL
ncbi:hypothetical protein M9H77_28363 [Catharanthus roseus]|uniref:Uncharacterized protein n=1 Tax=Catharanthus roseus TaxID=4058 RepID=A0ACC0AH19_CATRO|nr:hypothetical protein M9H77_28363 [Catharanthus roseus]